MVGDSDSVSDGDRDGLTLVVGVDERDTDKVPVAEDEGEVL
jgi:hypothetical protein